MLSQETQRVVNPHDWSEVMKTHLFSLYFVYSLLEMYIYISALSLRVEMTFREYINVRRIEQHLYSFISYKATCTIADTYVGISCFPSI